MSIAHFTFPTLYHTMYSYYKTVLFSEAFCQLGTVLRLLPASLPYKKGKTLPEVRVYTQTIRHYNKIVQKHNVIILGH